MSLTTTMSGYRAAELRQRFQDRLQIVRHPHEYEDVYVFEGVRLSPGDAHRIETLVRDGAPASVVERALQLTKERNERLNDPRSKFAAAQEALLQRPSLLRHFEDGIGYWPGPEQPKQPTTHHRKELLCLL